MSPDADPLPEDDAPVTLSRAVVLAFGPVPSRVIDASDPRVVAWWRLGRALRADPAASDAKLARAAGVSMELARQVLPLVRLDAGMGYPPPAD